MTPEWIEKFSNYSPKRENFIITVKQEGPTVTNWWLSTDNKYSKIFLTPNGKTVLPLCAEDRNPEGGPYYVNVVGGQDRIFSTARTSLHFLLASCLLSDDFLWNCRSCCCFQVVRLFLLSKTGTLNCVWKKNEFLTERWIKLAFRQIWFKLEKLKSILFNWNLYSNLTVNFQECKRLHIFFSFAPWTCLPRLGY